MKIIAILALLCAQLGHAGMIQGKIKSIDAGADVLVISTHALGDMPEVQFIVYYAGAAIYLDGHTASDTDLGRFYMTKVTGDVDVMNKTVTNVTVVSAVTPH